MNDWAEMVGALILLALLVLAIAAFFAAPGFIVLALAGYDDIGFWNSAAAGLGTLVILGLIFGSKS